MSQSLTETLTHEISQAIINFHFIRPLWIVALMPLAILIFLLWNSKEGQGLWYKVIPPHLLPYLLSGKNHQSNRLPVILISITWALSVIALSGPVWRQLPQAVEQRVDVQIILLDLSQSMNAIDLPPNRITRAKYKLSDILSHRDEGVTSLIVYAGDAHVVIPLTDDIKTIDAIIPTLDPNIMPVPGSNPSAAVEAAVAMLERGGHDEAEIILLTDGIKEIDVNRITTLISNRKVSLSVLGIGTKDGAPIPLSAGYYLKDESGAIVIPKLNRDALLNMAKELGGRYTEISADDSDIDYLLNKTLLLSETKKTTRQFDVWQEDGYWIIVFILPLAALAFRRGWLSCMLLTFLFAVPKPSQAGLWDDLWKTRDQQGYEAMKDNQNIKAADLFRSQSWKASAQYKSGQYDEAQNSFLYLANANREKTNLENTNPENKNPENKNNTNDDLTNDNPINKAPTNNQSFATEARLSVSDSYYNRGNSLAQMGRYNSAVEAYQQAIKLDPQNLDAQFNKALLEKLLEKEDNKQERPTPQNRKNNQHSQKPNTDTAENEAGKNKSDQSTHQKKETQLAEKTKPQRLTAKDQEALSQWLRRVDEDPGGLLRRKFALQAKTQELENISLGDSW